MLAIEDGTLFGRAAYHEAFVPAQSTATSYIQYSTKIYRALVGVAIVEFRAFLDKGSALGTGRVAQYFHQMWLCASYHTTTLRLGYRGQQIATDGFHLVIGTLILQREGDGA